MNKLPQCIIPATLKRLTSRELFPLLFHKTTKLLSNFLRKFGKPNFWWKIVWHPSNWNRHHSCHQRVTLFGIRTRFVQGCHWLWPAFSLDLGQESDGLFWRQLAFPWALNHSSFWPFTAIDKTTRPYEPHSKRCTITGAS